MADMRRTIQEDKTERARRSVKSRALFNSLQCNPFVSRTLQVAMTAQTDRPEPGQILLETANKNDTNVSSVTKENERPLSPPNIKTRVMERPLNNILRGKNADSADDTSSPANRVPGTMCPQPAVAISIDTDSLLSADPHRKSVQDKPGNGHIQSTEQLVIER